MINRHTKFEVATITCNEYMKSNTKICKNFRFEPLFGDFEVTHRVHLWLGLKRIVVFLLAIIEPFSLALTAEALLSEICAKLTFSEGVGHFEHKF